MPLFVNVFVFFVLHNDLYTAHHPTAAHEPVSIGRFIARSQACAATHKAFYTSRHQLSPVGALFITLAGDKNFTTRPAKCRFPTSHGINFDVRVDDGVDRGSIDKTKTLRVALRKQTTLDKAHNLHKVTKFSSHSSFSVFKWQQCFPSICGKRSV